MSRRPKSDRAPATPRKPGPFQSRDSASTSPLPPPFRPRLEVPFTAALRPHADEEQFAELFEFASLAMLLVDAQGLIQRANQHAGEILGYELSELRGRSIEHVVRIDLQMRHPSLRGYFALTHMPRATADVRPDAEAVRKDGTAFRTDVRLIPLHGAPGLIVALAVRDTAKQPRIESGSGERRAFRPEPGPIDAIALKEVSGGDVDLERQILRQLRRANESDVRLLEDALRRGDLDAIVQVAHRIKGSSSMVGAAALADAAERIERAARDGSLEHLEAEKTVFMKKNTELREYLERMLDERARPESSP